MPLLLTLPLTVGGAQELIGLLQEYKPLLPSMGLVWIWEETECIKRAAVA